MIDWIVNLVQKFQPEIKVENLATDDARRLDLQVRIVNRRYFDYLHSLLK